MKRRISNARLASFLLVSLLIVVSTLAACGGDDESEAEEASAAEVTEDDVPAEASPTVAFDELHARVVRELRTLIEIETNVYSAEKVVSVEKEGSRLWGLLGDEELFVVVSGEIRVGVELLDLHDGAVDIIDAQRVQVTLPASKVLSQKIDENNIRVVGENNVALDDSDQELRNAAIEIAQQEMLQDICDRHLLEHAAEDAETRIELVLSYLGFQDVFIESQAGSCP